MNDASAQLMVDPRQTLVRLDRAFEVRRSLPLATSERHDIAFDDIRPVSEARPTSDAPESTQVGAMTAISDLISKGLMVQALSVASRLRIADRLRHRPMEAAELASASKAHAPTLFRLLRALTGLGVLTEDDESRFALTQLGRALCGGPRAIRERAAFIGEPWIWQAWGNLYESVMTGDSAFSARMA